MELRVEGEPGAMDAGQSLHVLSLLAEVIESVSPAEATLPLTGLRIGSATAVVESPNVSNESLLQLVSEAWNRPVQLTRRLRDDLCTAFANRDAHGIEGFGFKSDSKALPYDASTHRRFKASLTRPIGWSSVSGEVRDVGRAQRGLSGKIRDSVHGHVVNFEAPDRLEDQLREVLFRRAAISGEAEVDDEGLTKRIIVERVEAIGPVLRLSDLDLSEFPLDSEATAAALKELRRG